MINMHDRWNKHRVFHINMLKQFHSSSDVHSNFLVRDIEECGIENDLPDDETPSWKNEQPTIGK